MVVQNAYANIVYVTLGSMPGVYAAMHRLKPYLTNNCCGSLLPVFGVRVSVTFHLPGPVQDGSSVVVLCCLFLV